MSLAKFSEIVTALGIKGEFRKPINRYLRTTPEYEQARSEGRARAWLEAEGDSMAETLYEVMTTRDLEP